MGLFTPIWMKKELNAKQEEKAYAKIRNMDEESLAAVVKTAPNANICGCAVKRIKDQQTLAWVAQNSSPYSIRLYAVQKLEDEPLLARIALNDDNESVRSAALEKVTDQKLLGAIAKKVKYTLRHHHNALDRIKDDAVLEDVALHNPDNFSARCAVSSMEDKDALYRVYESAKSVSVRGEAVERLIARHCGIDVLYRIYEGEKEMSIRAKAVKGMVLQHCDTDLLCEIARDNQNSEVFDEAFWGIAEELKKVRDEEADALSGDMVQFMIAYVRRQETRKTYRPETNETVVRLLRVLYKNEKYASSIEKLCGKPLAYHTDYHADCSCAQWGHVDEQPRFTLSEES